MLDAITILGNNDIIKEVPPENRGRNDIDNTRTPDFRVTKTSPYGANAWLFDGLKKK